MMVQFAFETIAMAVKKENARQKADPTNALSALKDFTW